MNNNWCTKYSAFEKKHKEILKKLDTITDKKELFEFYLDLTEKCFRACEEYDDRHEEEYDKDFIAYHDFREFQTNKLEQIVRRIANPLSYEYEWFGPFDNYKVDEDGDFIVYSPMYYADGTFVRNQNKYGISKDIFKPYDANNYHKCINDFINCVKEILTLYKELDIQIQNEELRMKI